VLKLADRLNLSKSETDELLLAAHFQQEYYTQGAPSSTADRGGHLYVAHIFIDENDEIPTIDITFTYTGSQTVLPMQVEVDVLDVGEFRFCDNEGDGDEDEDDLTRSFLLVSRNYDVKLSPALKGKSTSVKIAHLLRADEADRFQLKLNQDQAGWSLAYVWYYLRLTLLYDKPVRRLEAEPILLSLHQLSLMIFRTCGFLFIPPVANKIGPILQRMSKLEANRSASVEDIIRKVLGVKSKTDKASSVLSHRL